MPQRNAIKCRNLFKVNLGQKKNEVNIIVILPGWSVSILKHHIQKDMGIFVVFFVLNNHSESEPEQSFQCFILSSVLTRKDDSRRKLLLIRIICLRLITSSNDFTLETIGPTFSGGCSSTAFLIDGI